MNTVANQLMERRASLINQAQEIAQRGVTEGRELSVEEQTSFDQMIAEAGTLQQRAQAIHDGEQRGRELEESFRTGGAGAGEETRDNGLGKWARESRVGDSFDISPVHGAERRARLRVTGGEEARAMSATGGLGKDGVYGTLWEYAVAASQLLQAGVDIINTAEGNTLPLPRITSHADTSDTPTAANAAIPSSDSTIDTVDSTVSKYTFLTLVPNELLRDVTFDLEGYIAKNAGRQLSKRIAKVASAAAVAGFTTVGATGPTGTSTSLGNQSTAGQGSDLLVDLFHSVLPEYRTNAAWTMADPTAAMVRKLKTSTGEPVWQPSLQVGDPDQILGKPAYIDPFLPSPGASAKTIHFGEWDALKVRIAGGLRFERSADYAFGNDQTAFRAIVSTGAVVIDANAVKYFAHSAT